MARRKKSEIISEIATEPVKIEDAIQAVESDPIPVIEETPAETPVDVKEEKPTKKAAPKKAAPKKEEPTAAPKPAKKALKAGKWIELFAARVYPSSVAKQPRYLATGKCFILDTEKHDGRIQVALDESGEKRGWADVDELMR